MFCRKCGQPIEDDSKYCKHCGASVEQTSSGSSSKNIRSFYDKFVSLESKWQILILSYVLWVFIWVCVVILTRMFGGIDEYDIAMLLAFLAIFVLPFIVFATRHIAKLRKTKGKATDSAKDESMEVVKTIEPEKSGEEKVAENPPIVEVSEVNYGEEIERFTLKEFSLLYGKMQVKTVKSEDGKIQSYCAFTNGDWETKVEFDRKLGSLSAKEISIRKDNLCVVEYRNRIFVLTETTQS